MPDWLRIYYRLSCMIVLAWEVVDEHNLHYRDIQYPTRGLGLPKSC